LGTFAGGQHAAGEDEFFHHVVAHQTTEHERARHVGNRISPRPCGLVTTHLELACFILNPERLYRPMTRSSPLRAFGVVPHPYRDLEEVSPPVVIRLHCPRVSQFQPPLNTLTPLLPKLLVSSTFARTTPLRLFSASTTIGEKPLSARSRYPTTTVT